MSDLPPTDVDDDEPELHCYRHPGRETALRCNTCEKPICVDCSVAAAVGIKCRECARLPRAALARVPRAKLVTGLLAGAGVGLVAGVLSASLSFGFFGLIMAWLIGMAIGEVTRRGAGGYRDPLVARVAASCAFFGLLLPLLIDVVDRGAPALQTPSAAWALIGAIIAAVSAFNRAA